MFLFWRNQLIVNVISFHCSVKFEPFYTYDMKGASLSFFMFSCLCFHLFPRFSLILWRVSCERRRRSFSHSHTHIVWLWFNGIHMCKLASYLFLPWITYALAQFAIRCQACLFFFMMCSCSSNLCKILLDILLMARAFGRHDCDCSNAATHFLVHVHSFTLSKPGWLYVIAIVRFSWTGYVWDIPEKWYLRCGIGLNFLWCGPEFQVCCFLFYFEGFLHLCSCPCAPHFLHWLCSPTLRRFTCCTLTCPPLSI